MTLSVQFLTMAAMVSAGAAFGAMLDTYHRFLNRKNRKSWITFVNDILFWVVQALIVFYVLFHVNKGEIRFYIFLALLCGFAAYQALLKGAYLWILDRVINAAVTAGRFLAKTVRLLIFKPVTGLIQFAIALVLILMKAILSLLRLLLRIVYFLIRMLILLPLEKIFTFLWKLLPKGIKIPAKKLYNSGTGILLKARDVYKRVIRWNKKED
ncbi:spore cortex biosynthesis protein YabQ [Neobacillus piezotolerans]|uniref:Spore cortex biosynthesis protein YabQ n=1 Tax=Neobacillus piezotolerans TaxID=2259171 RepID=A0A3D8GK15_9BACI|nr:spore cortex biosynthesis protein YabQ [Neobacillus piezotolerans]RDU34790.1 spore cortex biosynthesis protein YabQ [Neobacillus piezotolerans]